MQVIDYDIKIAVNDITISYFDEGQKGKATLIFIHGFPFNKHMWDMQIVALKRKYRVIAYDIRGHGNSEFGNSDFSIELFVSDLIGIMNALKIDKAMLCGLSMGGYIALKAVEKHPERFTALVLCDTNCMADSPETKETRLKSIENIMEMGVEKFADAMLQKLFLPDSFITISTVIAAVKSMILKTSEQSLCNTLVALSQRQETCSKLNEIKIPVLILVGEDDIITPPDVAKAMHEKIANSNLFIIPYAGHVSNLENPNEFNDQLQEFLSKV